MNFLFVLEDMLQQVRAELLVLPSLLMLWLQARYLHQTVVETTVEQATGTPVARDAARAFGAPVPADQGNVA